MGTSRLFNYVAVIDTATNRVVARAGLPVRSRPINVALMPDGAFAYVTSDSTVPATLGEPKNPHNAHRSLLPEQDLSRIFTWQEERTLTNISSCIFGGKHFREVASSGRYEHCAQAIESPPLESALEPFHALHLFLFQRSVGIV